MRNKTEKLSKEHYHDNNPSVEDFQYVQAYQELLRLENKLPQFKSNDSITKKSERNITL